VTKTFTATLVPQLAGEKRIREIGAGARRRLLSEIATRDYETCALARPPGLVRIMSRLVAASAAGMSAMPVTRGRRPRRWEG